MQSFALKDGRQLAYTWFGAPRSPAAAPPPPATGSEPDLVSGTANAVPVILHYHGFLSSRLEGALLHADAAHHCLAVLAVDRPGAGGSTHNPAQSPDSTARDVVELLDGLGLESVYVQGASGGAPYACATAVLLGSRAAGLLLVCPLMPTAGREEELLAGTSPSTLRLFHGVRRHPWRLWAMLHALRLVQRIPHGNLLLRVGGFAEEDRRVMAALPHQAAAMQAAVREGLAQGVAAALQDLQLFYVDPPTLELASLRCKTHIWQGALDTTTPPAMARAYAAALPQARLHMLEGEGHLSLPFRHNRAILGSILRK